jgi:hypothetical protein
MFFKGHPSCENLGHVPNPSIMSLIICCENGNVGQNIKITMAILIDLSWSIMFCLTIIVCRNLCQAYLFKVGLTQIPADRKSLSIVHHVGLHVDLSSMKSRPSMKIFFGPLRPSPSCVK